METTELNLLSRDGIVSALIEPMLEGEQYAELHAIVCAAESADELRADVKKACNRWERTVSFE